MDRVTVYRCQRYFFVVLENGLSNDRTWRYNVAIGENDAAFAIDDKACRLGR